MIELFGFCFWPMVYRYVSFIVPSLPIFTPYIIFAYFFQPEKSTFFRGSTGIFNCLLTKDRSQSLTELLALFSFFSLVILYSSKLTAQQRWRKNPRSLLLQ